MLFGATCYGLWRWEPYALISGEGRTTASARQPISRLSRSQKGHSRTEVEEEIITWELLDQVTSFSAAPATGAGNP